MWALELHKQPSHVWFLIFSAWSFPSSFALPWKCFCDSKSQGDITVHLFMALKGWPTGLYNLNSKFSLPSQCLLYTNYYTRNQSWAPIALNTLYSPSGAVLHSDIRVHILWIEMKCSPDLGLSLDLGLLHQKNLGVQIRHLTTMQPWKRGLTSLSLTFPISKNEGDQSSYLRE